MKTEQKAGLCWRFAYPSEFVFHPDHTAHSGQIVTALRKMENADEAEVGPMYEIMALDGWLGLAYDCELEPIVNLTPRERADWPGLGDFPVIDNRTQAELAADGARASQRIADRIDGYDRDDLGASPDY